MWTELLFVRAWSHTRLCAIVRKYKSFFEEFGIAEADKIDTENKHINKSTLFNISDFITITDILNTTDSEWLLSDIKLNIKKRPIPNRM